MPTGVYERKPLRQRFDEKWVLDEATGCHLWTGAALERGYGLIRDRRRNWLAHRVAWELARGPIPDGLCVRHKVCDNPRCVNVAHLAVGDQVDNMADMRESGRQSRGAKKSAVMRRVAARGEAHYRSRLSDAQVAEIRATYAAGGVTQKALGAAFGCHAETVGSIVRGENRVPRSTATTP